ncbi:MAG: hypothetical protein JWN95_3289 [Frankiales bacterium]|nr:hypothetical protein [Frankiales bacterium]
MAPTEMAGAIYADKYPNWRFPLAGGGREVKCRSSTPGRARNSAAVIRPTAERH